MVVSRPFHSREIRERQGRKKEGGGRKKRIGLRFVLIPTREHRSTICEHRLIDLLPIQVYTHRMANRAAVGARA